MKNTENNNTQGEKPLRGTRAVQEGSNFKLIL